MSGIAGLVATGGRQVDRALLDRLALSIRFRGPDRQASWYSPEAAFVHSLLATTVEAERERQPCSLGDSLYITADCRIDGQQELRANLTRLGHPPPPAATDPELILLAYAAWGDRCVEHLLGDFAFAIWDAPRKRLFCARDHSGIKPFFYATPPGGFVFGNTIASLRLHPEIPGGLNELAILDYFLFGLNQEPDTTTYAGILALPPASSLIWQNGHTHISRYWTRPIDPPLLYRNPVDYIDEFEALLDTAVRDRLRTPKLSVQMSGGLDSTLLAAAAKRVAGPAVNLEAHSIYFADLIPDTESSYTQAAADHLGIPLKLICADSLKPYDGFPDILARSPQPLNMPNFIHGVELLRSVAKHGRVFFYGEGPDNLLRYEWKPYLRFLRRERSPFGLALSVLHSLWLDPRMPLSTAPRRRNPPGGDRGPDFPPWLRPEMVTRYRLKERWTSYWTPLTSNHPYHPNAYASMSIANWSEIFSSMDPGVSGLAVEGRHPFLDIRLARFLLAVPVVPWCRRKLLCRQAAKRCLPRRIWAREKTYLGGDPLLAHASAGHFDGHPLPPLEDFAAYVVRWPELDAASGWGLFHSSSPFALQYWLASQQRD